jgi:peptidylprolyl isomerase
VARRRRLLILLAAGLVLIAACGEDDSNGDAAGSPANGCEEGAEINTESGLTYVDTECGTGAEATTGTIVTVHYTGTLENGTEFDSSRGREPFTFNVGAGEVIQGWEQGIPGMKVGGVRELTIPPELGYGAAGAPPAIPPNATLIFEVELLEVG